MGLNGREWRKDGGEGVSSGALCTSGPLKEEGCSGDPRLLHGLVS